MVQTSSTIMLNMVGHGLHAPLRDEKVQSGRVCANNFAIKVLEFETASDTTGHDGKADTLCFEKVSHQTHRGNSIKS